MYTNSKFIGKGHSISDSEFVDNLQNNTDSGVSFTAMDQEAWGLVIERDLKRIVLELLD